MRAMILAAGLGTRLRPLTDELPKPVVPVGNEPLAARALRLLTYLGATTLAVNTHHLGERVREQLAPLVPSGVNAEFLHEIELLGTGGALANARSVLAPGTDDAPVVVMNGDVLFAPRLADAIALHRATGAIATMVLRAHDDPFRLGAIEIDRDGVVRQLLGKEPTPALRAFMFTGVHVFSQRAFADFPQSGCVIRSAYRAWMARGERVVGFVEDAPWRDLGTPAEYLAANLELAPRVHPRARVDGASLVRCVVGADAEVRPGVVLEDCVVWPGAVVTQSAERTVFTPKTALPVP